MISIEIRENRNKFLIALRSGNYQKGTIRSDKKGIPIIKSPEDDNGYCACAIMMHLFDPQGKSSTLKSRQAIGITGKECKFIQEQLNDTDLTFNEIADQIECKIFKK